MSNNILFITKGDSQTGFGHISRSLLIADEFKSLGYSSIFLVSESCTFIPVIEQRGYKAEVVKSFNESINKKELSSFITSNSISVVIIDTIEEDYLTLSPLKQQLSNDVLLVTITLFLFSLDKRYEDISFFPDFTENTEAEYLSEYGKVKLYSGKNYLTIRPEFALEYDVKEIDKKDVLITMGGTDPEGFTLKALNALKDSGYSITVLLSASSNTYDKVKEVEDKNANVSVITFSNSIAEIMYSHKVLLINGGLTRYEACALGVPFIAISIHQVQYDITEKVTSTGAGINLGIGTQLSTSDIRSAVTALIQNPDKRKQISSTMKKIIDTTGSKNIVQTILNYNKNA
ncbi:hypothetical protein E0W68_00670 [Flavobacterium salilacus subsp. salilacus]|uniref:hypothetical protein n=1 Tax=Flavobacterium TaxID=237 RepID=UPI001074B0AC|nr:MULTISPECIES: hypothetical protein [Flavobacterium]KAF2519776.1 hypothetical protein E0W68_00670 [Flavobacterium salilacus subsp. salilacus]MBE1614326.1 hypothetical protein [Flavobacterium sp. SaA2.13]